MGFDAKRYMARRAVSVVAMVGLLNLAPAGGGGTSAVAAEPQPVDCSVSTIYVSQNVFVDGRIHTQLFKLEYGSGSNSFTAVGDPYSDGYNALGFNSDDNFFYAVDKKSQVIRIDATGAVTVLGATTPGLPADRNGVNNSGAFDSSGVFYVGSSRTQAKDKLQVIDVTDMTKSVVQLIEASTGEPVSVRLPADYSFVGSSLWGYVDKRFVRVNPVSGVVDRFVDDDDLLPANITAGAAWTYANGNLGLGINETGKVNQIEISDPDGPSPTFTLVSKTSGPTSTGNDGTTCSGPPADLGITKSGPAIARAGDQISWTLTVTNHGPGISSGYVVTDDVPASVTGLSAEGPAGGDCDIVGNEITCTGNVVPVGDSNTITITGTVPSTPSVSIENTATVLGNEADEEPANNTSSATTTVFMERCRATAVAVGAQTFGTANKAEDPCGADHQAELSHGAQPGAMVAAEAISGETQSAPPSASAEADVAVAMIDIPSSVSIEASSLHSSASLVVTSCVSPQITAESSVGSLTINGTPVSAGDQPLTIPVASGFVHLNHKVVSGGAVIQRALFLDLPGTSNDVILAETTVGVVC